MNLTLPRDPSDGVRTSKQRAPLSVPAVYRSIINAVTSSKGPKSNAASVRTSHHEVISLISVLLAWRCPAAVSRLITALVVYSIKTCAGRFRSQFVKECLKLFAHTAAIRRPLPA